MSCSQPWVLWQPCVGRWVLCVRTTKLVVSSQSQKKKPFESLPSLCVCAACIIHPHRTCVCSSDALLCLLLLQQRSPAVWFVWLLPLWRKNAKALLLFFFGASAVSVAEATAGSTLDGGNIALAVFILVLLLSVLLGGAYVYVTRWALRALGLPAWSPGLTLKSCLWLPALGKNLRCWHDFTFYCLRDGLLLL